MSTLNMLHMIIVNVYIHVSQCIGDDATGLNAVVYNAFLSMVLPCSF